MQFPEMLVLLRRQKGISQKQAAKDLKISQALLSHYENGVREPKFEFVDKACAYYGVSADYILGRLDADSVTVPCRDDTAQLGKAVAELVSQLNESGSQALSGAVSSFIAFSCEEALAVISGGAPSVTAEAKFSLCLQRILKAANNEATEHITDLIEGLYHI